jgi:hypothetical protein
MSLILRQLTLLFVSSTAKFSAMTRWEKSLKRRQAIAFELSSVMY